MPYSSEKDVPEYVKKYSSKARRQWIHVFNSVYDKVIKEGGKDAEARAFRAANSVLKKRFSREKHSTSIDHSDYFNMLMDKFLGKLEG